MAEPQTSGVPAGWEVVEAGQATPPPVRRPPSATPSMSAAYPGSGSSPEAVASQRGFMVPDPTGGHWQSTDGSERGRVDNSVLGLPPELAAISAVSVGRAIAAPAVNGIARLIAGTKAVIGQAAPAIKYELTRTTLEKMGVPSVLAIPAAIAVSGYKKGAKATTAAVETAAPAAPIDVRGAASSMPTQVYGEPTPGTIGPRAGAPPAPYETAIAASKKAVAAGYTGPAAPASPPAPAAAASTPSATLAKAKPTLTLEEFQAAKQLVDQGYAPEDVLNAIARNKLPKAWLHLPGDDDVAAAVADRNSTGRWPQDRR